MSYAGTFFGMGTGKVLVIISFMIVGLLIALNRKIIPLSLVFFLTYVGSLFSKGNGKIYTTVLFFIIGLYLSKKLLIYFNKTETSRIIKFFI